MDETVGVVPPWGGRTVAPDRPFRQVTELVFFGRLEVGRLLSNQPLRHAHARHCCTIYNKLVCTPLINTLEFLGPILEFLPLSSMAAWNAGAQGHCDVL